MTVYVIFINMSVPSGAGKQKQNLKKLIQTAWGWGILSLATVALHIYCSGSSTEYYHTCMWPTVQWQ